MQHLRRTEVFHTIRLIYEDKGNLIDIGRIVFCTSLNLLGNMIFSTRVFDSHNPASAGFNHSVCELMRLGGKPNLVDFFPFLRLLDPQGVCCQMSKHFQAMYDFVDLFLQKRLAASESEGLRKNDSAKDFLDVLLDSRSQDFTPADIRPLIAEFSIAGTETTTSTVEWGMAEFIRNPEKLNRLRQEMDEVVGPDPKVEESDLDRLPYLRAAVKETFRLHTPVPLLLPHKAQSTCVVEGFVIPKDTQVFVNVWAIARDPSNCKVDYRGQNFELIPFGAGRRICAGLSLADRMVHLILASLLHSFDWVLLDGMSYEEMDMRDELGITLKKSALLNAIPIPRLSHHAFEK